MGTWDKISNVKRAEETVTIDLGAFSKVYRGATFDVWVTPDQAFFDRFDDNNAWLQEASTKAKSALEKLAAHHKASVEQWSKDGKSISEIADLEAEYLKERNSFDLTQADQLDAEWEERTIAVIADAWLNIELDEARQIRDHLKETNPAAWDWLFQRTTKTIGEYKARKLKN